MNQIEFDDWIRRVGLMFPGIEGWLDRKDDDERAETIALWRSRTSRMPLDQADAALESMFNSERTPNASIWFKVFCATAKRFTPRSTVVEIHDGQILTDCPNVCSLDGFVSVRDYSEKTFNYHMARIKKSIAERHDPIGRYFIGNSLFSLSLAESLTEKEWRDFIAYRHPGMILCNCAKGDRGPIEGKKLPRFDPERFTLIRDADRNYFPKPITEALPNGLRELE